MLLMLLCRLHRNLFHPVYQDCLDPPHGEIVVVRQHGEEKWTFERMVIQQDFIKPRFMPPLFTSQQFRGTRIVFGGNCTGSKQW